ncbi:MAG: hypothetical protein ACPL07_00205 [Candidatus Bathyarchaeia archaeon]
MHLTLLGLEIATTIVVFAEEKDFEVLGVYVLEDLGLEVDPTTKGNPKPYWHSMLSVNFRL